MMSGGGKIAHCCADLLKNSDFTYYIYFLLFFSHVQRTGLLSMLDVECSVRGFPATYVQKVKVQHKDNRKLFEPKHCDLTRTFGIHHYAGSVVYDTSQFLETNKDVIGKKQAIEFESSSSRVTRI